MRRTSLAILGCLGLGVSLAGWTGSADAQTTRRPPGGGTPRTPPGSSSTTPPETTPPETTPPAPGPPGAPGQNPQDRAQRPVDPEMIARIVDTQGPMTLLNQPAVQEDLGITKEQLEKMKAANETLAKQREEFTTRMREQFAANARQGGPGGQGGQPAQGGRGVQGGRGGPGGGGPGGGGYPGQPGGPGGFGGGPGGFGGGPGGFGGGPGGFGGGPGGFGGRGQGGNNPFTQMMQEMTATVKKQSDEILGSLLTPEQRKRFNEILLQARGPFYVAQPELQERLNMQVSQREQIAMIMQEYQMLQEKGNNARRDLFRASFAQGGRGGQGQAQGAPGGAQAPAGAATRTRGDASQTPAQGGTTKSESDSETPAKGAVAGEEDDRAEANANRRARFEIPEETRKKMEELEADSKTLREKAIQKIARVLTSRQKTNYNKMLGKEFDFSKLDMGLMMSRGGGRGGDRGGQRGGR